MAKKCRVCEQDRPLDHFHIRKDTGKVRNECKTCHASKQMRRSYGITLEEYDVMYEQQKGVCAICSLPQTGRAERLCVDHNHETGKVRGLLCSHCNRGIGLLKDDYRILNRAASYLREKDEV